MQEISSIGEGDILSGRFKTHRPVVPGGRHWHLCLACALSRHDFEERAPEAACDGYDAAPPARASIDRLSYRSVYHAPEGVECTNCGERVKMAYHPEYMQCHQLRFCKTDYKGACDSKEDAV